MSKRVWLVIWDLPDGSSQVQESYSSPGQAWRARDYYNELIATEGTAYRTFGGSYKVEVTTARETFEPMPE